MTGLKRFVVIFSIMFTISLAAAVSGIYLLYIVKQDVYPPSLSVGLVDIGGLNKQAAYDKIKDKYDNILKNDSFRLILEDKTDFPIKYSDIDASIDYEATAKAINGINFKESLIKMLKAYYYKRSIEIIPVVKFNHEKLKTCLEKLVEVVKKEPINADIYIENDKIIKIEEKNGQILDINNTASKISNEIGIALSNNSFIELNAYNKFEISSVAPNVTIKDFVNADSIISSYYTEINVLDNLEMAKIAVSAINRVLLRPEDAKSSREGGEFSFNKYLMELAKTNLPKTNLSRISNEGFNQVAATLNAAIIKAGLNPLVIKTHDHPADYIELGLDAVITPDVQDYRFKNTTEYPIIIFSEINSNRIYVNVVGKLKDANMKNSIRVDMVNKTEPIIVNVENNDLQQGEKRVVVQGRQGSLVKVYRETHLNDKKAYENYLYEVEYKATETIVQVGPGTDINNQNSK